MPAPMMQPMPRKHEVPRAQRALELAGFGFLLHLLYAFAHHEACKQTSLGALAINFPLELNRPEPGDRSGRRNR
jgi:hypothetical protein